MGTPTQDPHPTSPPRCGRYELLVRIGKGGMASVYLARVGGVAGFVRLYALKVMHAHLSSNEDFVHMLMDEAKIASRLHHPNVVSTVDLGQDGDRYFMVMDYVEGVALDRLLRRHPAARDPELIVPLAVDALRGLHAAHTLKDESGSPLDLVHRDVTPGNVIVGVDGTARIADFGVAKARARITKTNPGIVKGKAGYIAPEVILGHEIDGRADVFSMGVLLWNALTGETLFDTDDLASTLTKLLKMDVPPPSTVGLAPPPIFDAPILGALHREPRLRHDSALEMAHALEDAMAMAGYRTEREAIGEWVHETFGPQLKKRRQYAAAGRQTDDPDGIEPPSTSAMVRKDPSGKLHAKPAELAEDRFSDGQDEDDQDEFLSTVADGEPTFDVGGAPASAELRVPSPDPDEHFDRPTSTRAIVAGVAVVAVIFVLGLIAAYFYGSASRPAAEAAPNVAPAVTDAPGTDVPETDAPRTDEPGTDAPETDAPETDEPTTDAERAGGASDPASDANQDDAEAASDEEEGDGEEEDEAAARRAQRRRAARAAARDQAAQPDPRPEPATPGATTDAPPATE